MNDPTAPGGDPGNAPRTDLPPTREPYDDDYFGTGEEEGVVREREATGDEPDEGKPAPVADDEAGVAGQASPG